MKIVRRDGGPLIADQLHVTYDSQFLDVESESADGVIMLRVTLLESSPPDVAEMLRLSLANGHDLLEIPVHARRQQPVTISPSAAVLRYNHQEGTWSDSTFIVTDHRQDSLLGEMNAVEVPGGLHVKDEGAMAGGRKRRLHVSVVDRDRWERHTGAANLVVSFEGVAPLTVGVIRHSE